ncbi:chemotaxis response regulator protein-glutamate methylesterase [Paenibacillus sp. YPG26]|uniref:protein-glutamate methylesterase/protein-glutamine glutaminase n=1 Tax=Paenibacillus sp. YPG26 TaxID=2878915 RepID=UPI00203ABA5B|nr:chemotaxis response regulator protein-glutamate methylesterase [Paenibacillus sp. YPG26]USB31749.1 chemotaxis response regulator protein-glutamate methylesterase [Paenibacillus sp. YPG26]
MEKRYGVLVVDDSAFMRKTISSMIEDSPDFFVIGRARNGVDAIDKVKRFKPAIVTLDIEMPELNGLETLEILMNEYPVPVVMLSNGADSTLEAFELGAVDFVIKEQLIQQNDGLLLEDFYRRLTAAATAKLPTPLKKTAEEASPVEIIKEAPHQKNNSNKDILIIGSSTGGPAALQTILTRFPAELSVPVLVIQHMPPGFTKPLADRFDGLCSLRVKEAEHNEILQPGTIYIAPAGLQTTLKKNVEGEYIVRLKITSNIETLYKPSIDVTLLSIAAEAGVGLLTVILTGMGDDGLRGCTSVKKSGGMILAESEETCIVYGMPKVVFEAGLVDKQLPLPLIFNQIMTIVYN